MTITMKLTDRDTGICPHSGLYEPEERYSEYGILADGKPTGWTLKRLGTDLAELVDPDGNDEYLSTSDLRSAIPEAKRIMLRRRRSMPDRPRVLKRDSDIRFRVTATVARSIPEAAERLGMTRSEFLVDAIRRQVRRATDEPFPNEEGHQ